MSKKFTVRFTALLLLLAMLACESERRIPPKGYIPNTPKPTEQLEAAYFWLPQNQIKSSYWKAADYLEVTLKDLQTRKLYSDGYLNMTGTYDGLKSFNNGNDPQVKLRAGYDDEYLYIMVEWKDTTTDASYASWLWDGPADANKSDSTGGWTSQRNNDNFTILFDKDGSQDKDAWKWSLALSAPFDKAFNLKLDAQGNLSDPDGIIRNSNGSTPRSGPAYEWNGVRQEILLADSTKMLLDPGYYLLDNFKIPVTGSAEEGQIVFNKTADCRYCHGPDADGFADGETQGGSLQDVFINRFSRRGLLTFISSSGHEGSGDQYWGRIANNSNDTTNLVAFLRSVAGIPGYSLVKPETAPTIKALTNVGIGSLKKANGFYQVLLIRKLNTGNPDDIQFTPGNTYKFSIRLSDDDDLNYVGATDLELTFKSNAL